MSRYIDADEIQYIMLYKENWITNTGIEKQGVWKDDIDMIPTADVVEVVRCKDCKYRKKNTFCLHNMRYEDDNGFCSYGERAEECPRNNTETVFHKNAKFSDLGNRRCKDE